MKKNAPHGSLWVATGILLSRVAGLVRERVFAHYFGNSDAGDAFKAALKIPNFLQNLFGEGVLSASFIPVYSRLIHEGKREVARRVAWSVGAGLILIVSIFVLLGMGLTPYLIEWIAPGFEGPKRELTERLVRIFFPGAGLLVLSAWCLGILNSHRQFFISYSAPVFWNLSIIGSLVYFGGKGSIDELAVWAAWGLLLGSALQLIVQLPFAWKWIRRTGPSEIEKGSEKPSVDLIRKNFFPVVVGRGVVQISAYVDNIIASLLPTGAVSALAYAQTLSLLPISLFGMSITAAELPELSSIGDQDETAKKELKTRMASALDRISFFVIPSSFAFLFIGDSIVAALFQTGEFKRQDSLLVWGILAASAFSLLPSTWGRLYSSALYALKDVRTPLRFSIVRIILALGLGAWGALKLPHVLGVAQIYGTVAMVLASAGAAWVEYSLLVRSVGRRLGRIEIDRVHRRKCLFSASIAGILAFAGKEAFDPNTPHVLFTSLSIIGFFGAVYFIVGALLGLDTARRVCARFGLNLGE